MKKQIVIRVDSGNIIGFGHAMRCLTIANQMKKHNYNVSIISSKEKNNLDQIEVLYVVIISLIISLIATVFPAYRSSLIDPIKSLKND